MVPIAIFLSLSPSVSFSLLYIYIYIYSGTLTYVTTWFLFKLIYVHFRPVKKSIKKFIMIASNRWQKVRHYRINIKWTKISMVVVVVVIIYSLRVFHISVSWWSFTEVLVSVSLLKPPGLFSVFWPFSTML